MTPIEIVLAFMDRINQRDPDRLSELMTQDHVLIENFRARDLFAQRHARLFGFLDLFALSNDQHPF